MRLTWIVVLLGPLLTAQDPDFQQEVRPILSDRCFTCHGPDAGTRKADLRLDLESEARKVIDLDDPDSSLLLERVRHADAGERMPPEGDPLTEQEIEVLRRWIVAGARFEKHWAFQTPARPAVPNVTQQDWVRNPIDAFVLSRLETEGLTPSPPAERTTLLRRAALDLTGLPPETALLEAHRREENLDGYVDALFASPRHGEHLARHWLDSARYGDTHGFHLDNLRSLWPWRDWVIQAFQNDMPFDRFTIEQVGGDLLPQPTTEQLVATGFNRCNPTTGEGGLIAAEYLARYAKDRVDTVGMIWLGLTVGCANCHDHKFDPLSQREYYQLYAFFNSIDEQASDRNALTPPPSLVVPTDEQRASERALDQEITALEQRLSGPFPELDARQSAWETAARSSVPTWHRANPISALSEGGASLTLGPNGLVTASGDQPDRDVYTVVTTVDTSEIDALRLLALAGPGKAGRASHGNIVLSGVRFWATVPSRPLDWQELKIASATADHNQRQFDIDRSINGDDATGWALAGQVDRAHAAVFQLDTTFRSSSAPVLLRAELQFRSGYKQHAIREFALEALTGDAARPAEFTPWELAGPYPTQGIAKPFEHAFEPEQSGGTTTWRSDRKLVDDKTHTLPGPNVVHYLRRRIQVTSPRTLRFAFGSDDAIKVWCDGKPILERNVRRPVAADQDEATVTIQPGEHELLVKVVDFGGGHGVFFRLLGESEAIPLDLALALRREPDQRDEASAHRVRAFHRRANSPEFRQLEQDVRAARGRREELRKGFARTMISRERREARPAHIMRRGLYNEPGEQVERGVPAFLHAFPDGAPANRLGLAQWLVARDNPLTARVTVNRIWQWVFGAGLVRTPEDFGLQGQWPSHPELLDWLAVEFMESGWSVRHILRLILESNTWRQASDVRPELVVRDPENRLLARSPAYRLDAECIRDGALQVSGLLIDRVGGPSVKPYQPGGIWQAVAYTSSNTARFQQDQGEALWRRSLYTFWKRTAPPPTLALFDAPTRESCVVLRSRTNTPLQALALLNDVQFVEAARNFAQRIANAPGDNAQRAAWAFREATSRAPDAAESAILLRLFEEQRTHYAQRPDDARALLAVGDSPPTDTKNPAKQAAWTVVANMLLNLHEVVTRR